MEMQSLVIVMAVGRYNQDYHFFIEDAIDETMFLRYLSAPTTFGLSFQWLWMASACLGMLCQFLDKVADLCECFRFVALQTKEVVFCVLGKTDDVHISPHGLRMTPDSRQAASRSICPDGTLLRLCRALPEMPHGSSPWSRPCAERLYASASGQLSSSDLRPTRWSGVP